MSPHLLEALVQDKMTMHKREYEREARYKEALCSGPGARQRLAAALVRMAVRLEPALAEGVRGEAG